MNVHPMPIHSSVDGDDVGLMKCKLSRLQFDSLCFLLNHNKHSEGQASNYNDMLSGIASETYHSNSSLSSFQSEDVQCFKVSKKLERSEGYLLKQKSRKRTLLYRRTLAKKLSKPCHRSKPPKIHFSRPQPSTQALPMVVKSGQFSNPHRLKNGRTWKQIAYVARLIK